MATFVLVHGAWQTASTWDLVTPRLRAAGHAVHVPPLSGLENDSTLLSPATCLQTHIEQAESTGGGWLLRAGEAQLDLWGLKPGAERDFVRSRLSDFSLRCFEEAVRLPTNAAARIHRTFIACVAEGYPARPVFQRFSDRAKREAWGCHELATGHDCHVEMPDAFVSKLLGLEGWCMPPVE